MAQDDSKQRNPIDDTIDSASLIFGVTASGTVAAAKFAEESLENTKRFKIANKIGKLVKSLDI